MADADRVRTLIGPDGEKAFAIMTPQPAGRDALVTAALTEYRDARLAAAYVLEQLCSDQQQRAGQGVQRVKIEGIDIELSGTAGSEALAATFCARAKTLRQEYRRSTQSIVWATPQQVRR